MDILQRKTRGKFSPVQLLGYWLFANPPLPAIVKPLFWGLSGGSFFNPDAAGCSSLHVLETSQVCMRKAFEMRNNEESRFLPGATFLESVPR
ncbi:hypothetical protein AV530_016282 [Patagioenas fasciata monilis]|uniref:Uncharacterized protein n=1 Tax=Patagioenas fasciata monilis TaxID=372326 RepID=A0A1V4JWP8_PATFA|nr:hypothetical protein AV530_016282 [Patagioenas fasciata monilis]